MKEKVLQWFIFIVLSLIWGSSFKLMKVGMETLSPYEVASLRMLSAGLVLLPFAFKAMRGMSAKQFGWVLASGLLGSFFPAYLFCIAETRIDSSLAGILNALTPIFALLIGIMWYKFRVGIYKIAGLTIGFAGLVLLFITRGDISFGYLSFAGLVLLATIFYGMNINLVSYHLTGQSPVIIASLAFGSFIIPSVGILLGLGFFQHPLAEAGYLRSTAASIALGVMGTAVATVLYYVLIKRAGGFFASMVTYGIPFVAVGWGLHDGETITGMQVLCLTIILAGVYMTSIKAKEGVRIP